MPSLRLCFVLIALSSALAIGIGLIMQYHYGMEPCPLCISQRIFIILAGIAALFAALMMGKKRIVAASAIFGVLFTCIGGSISARHVWIQNLPEDQVPICGPGLGYMFETRPVFEALSLLFAGDGHCADVNFTLFGLSIPGWTLLYFITLTFIFLWLFWRNRRPEA